MIPQVTRMNFELIVDTGDEIEMLALNYILRGDTIKFGGGGAAGAANLISERVQVLVWSLSLIEFKVRPPSLAKAQSYERHPSQVNESEVKQS